MSTAKSLPEGLVSVPPRAAGPSRSRLELTTFYHSFLDFFQQLSGTAKRFWLLVITTGVIAGLSAVALLHLLHFVQAIAWPGGGSFLEAVQRASPLHRVLACVVGGALVTLSSLAWRRPLGGHGTAGIIEAIWVKRGNLSFARSLVRGAVSIVAVALGASLGREGALLQTGAATGSVLARRLRCTDEQARLLVACGAAAGFSAVYNVPIGGALFGLEVLLGSFALELFGPIVVSCVVATVISRILVADHPSYLIPHYQLMGAPSVTVAVLCAPLFGAASALYVRSIDAASELVDTLPAKLRPFLPPIGLAILGLAAVKYPELLGNGYDTVDGALLGRLPLVMLIALPFLKLAATALCSATGTPGGLFTPSLYFGALLGGALGVIGHRVAPGLAPSGAFALLGMAAVLAGTTHATVSTVLIIFEMTGDYELILPLMLTCVISAAVSRRLEPESLYTAALRRRDVPLPEPPRPSWLREKRVAEFVEPGAQEVEPGARFDEVVRRLLLLPPGHDLYVTRSDGTLLGWIALEALKRSLADLDELRMIVAADVMSPIPAVTPHSTLGELAERFAELDTERLPVVDDSRRLVGTVAKRAILRTGRF